jgi:hypothetical protein
VLTAHLEQLGLVCPTCRAYGRPAPRLARGTMIQIDATPWGEDLIEGVLVCPALPARAPDPRRRRRRGRRRRQLGRAPGRRDACAATICRRSPRACWATRSGAAAASTRSATICRRTARRSGATAPSKIRCRAPGGWPSWSPPRSRTLPAPPDRRSGSTPAARSAAATLDLAAAGAALVVGVDLNMAMLRRAEVRRAAPARSRWPRRRVGQVFDPGPSRAATTCPRDRVAFVCADVNVLAARRRQRSPARCRSTSSTACRRRSPTCASSGGWSATAAPVLLSTPYDWATNAASMEHWIGGHSQRAAHQGASEPELRRLLSPERATGIDTGLTIAAERDDVPWHLTLNARSANHYRLHLLRLARTPRG